MLRLLTFSTLFPNREQPEHGVFVENRLRHLLAGGEVLPEARAKEVAAFEKLCELDPSTAMKLTLG